MLPITRVVLFKHGVAHFERRGSVTDDARIELGFKAEQMNDVLKSLTALDFGGGTFGALTYDSEEPIERRLSELNMAIPKKGAIAAFLDTLKGARVSCSRGAGKLEGAVVGIDEVERVQDGQIVRDAHLAILAEGGRLVRVPLLEVDELQFEDEAIRRDLRALLDVLFASLRKDRKRFAIHALGKGERQVSLGYVVETPVWKTSYRIMLPVRAEEKPLLQGWALVDNTTEDDWVGVRLSLVAGLPISFVHDLYTPRHRRRPIVRVEEAAAVAPPVVEAGRPFELEEEMGAPAAAAPMPGKGGRRMAAFAAASPPPPAPSMAERSRASVQVRTRTQEMGDLFAYEITHPVDVPRGRSALVPILQAEAEIERVAIYNREIRDKNPMTAFRIKNNTGLTLEGGPVTVFEGETYVGEAMLETLRREDERLTPYSVELGIAVKQETCQKRERSTGVRKSGQYIHVLYRNLLVTSYEIHSRLERSVPFYLDHRFSHPIRESTQEPVEVTDHFWRFKLEVPARKTTRFAVTEVSEQSESIDIPGITHAAITNLVSSELISLEMKAALERIAEQAKIIVEIEREIDAKQKQEKKIASDQNRLRENLRALGASSDETKLRQKYVASLANQEEQLEEAHAQLEVLDQRLKRAKEELEERVAKLEV